MAFSAVAVLERHLTLYRRLFWASAFSSFLLPVLFLVSIGLGVGGYVGDLDGVTYLQWIVPGVMASTAFQMALGETTFPVLGDFKWTRGYHAMRATPVRIGDMIAGQVLFLMVRVLPQTVVFLLVVLLFGGLRSWWSVVTPLVCAAVVVASALPVMGYASRIDNDGYFALLFRFVMIPMTLFAGVFFPVDQLPVAAQWLAWVSPLWHGVELCRSATLGVAPPWPIWAHVLCLVAWSAGGAWFAMRGFARRLAV
ncbi:ABC transporter permease [Herbidospora sp. RD11066]